MRCNRLEISQVPNCPRTVWMIGIVVSAWALLGFVEVHATPGYWTDRFGNILRNLAGECLHTSYWSPDKAVVGCDGKVVAEPAPAPAPPAELVPDPTLMPAVGVFPVYPWPPEQPSSLVSLTQSLRFAHDRFTSLYQVSEMLSQALETSGYFERRYYRAPDGFALVTRLEQTDADGTPLAEGTRYLLPGDDRNFSFVDYVRSLFFVPDGYYRFIAFIVTDQPYTPTQEVLPEDEAITRLQGGSVALPNVYHEMQFTDAHRLDALIYEFHITAHTDNVKPVLPGRLPPNTHLEKSGLLTALQHSLLDH